MSVGLFLLPNDPALPGLALIENAQRASDIIGADVVTCQRRRYRPLTRAVVELTMADGTTRWVKAVPPRRTRDLADVHRRCCAAVDGPTVLSEHPDLGLVVLSHVPGDDLRTRLRTANATLPAPTEVIGLATRLASVTSPTAVRRPPPLASTERNLVRLRSVLPTDGGDRLDQLEHLLPTHDATAAAGPGPTIHGDLHSAQVMIGSSTVSGLVDLDDAGAGDPTDDLARFIAHLVCTTDRKDGRWAQPWSHELIRQVQDLTASESLQPRVAAQLVSLALGPHRVHRDGWQAGTSRRLDLAVHWARPATVTLPWGADP